MVPLAALWGHVQVAAVAYPMDRPGPREDQLSNAVQGNHSGNHCFKAGMKLFFTPMV